MLKVGSEGGLLKTSTVRRPFVQFLATISGPEDTVSLYFIPRDRNKARFTALSGLIGGLEVLGELVFSSEEDKKLLDRDHVNYSL